MKVERNILFIFNLETDLESPVLAMGHSWIESFAINNFKKVYVFSTHVGLVNLPGNVKVFEIGGGNFIYRVRAVFRLILSALIIIRHSRSALVFHHMSVRTALFPGLVIKILRIPQGLWYSHSSLSVSLKLTLRIVDLVFTSTPGSTAIESNKLRYTGHGIDYKRYPSIEDVLKIQKTGIVSLGRLARVKNLDKIIHSGKGNSSFPRITFVGPEEKVLAAELRNLALEEDVELRILPAIPHEEVPQVLSRYSFYYSGTPKSVDKAVLEAASVGCIIITEERPAIELTGMNLEWKKIGQNGPINLSDQILLLQSLPDEEVKKVRRSIMEFTRTKNNVVNTTRIIIEQLRELR